MSEVSFKFKIEGDDDGYVSFECPFCESSFRLKAGEFQNDDPIYTEMYCPYCGLNDKPNNFYTKEVIEQATAIATNYVHEQINKAFGKMARDMNRNKYVKMSFKPLKNIHIKDMDTKESIEEIFECKHCNNHVKVLYCSGVSKVFCSYCGVDI